MPHDEPTISPEVPAMPSEEPAIHDNPVADTATETQHGTVREPDTARYEPADQPEEWLEEPPESDLPRRPRRRLLGVGGNPIPLALIGVLLIACGFIGGVLVEKGQSSSSPAAGGAAGLASRFAALRGAAGAGTSGGSAGSGRGATGGGSTGSLFGGGGGAGGATVGQVAYVSGHTLYVTNAEGNTVKVTTSAGSTVNKTVKSDVKGIHPGETVIVTGATGADGSVSAESIRVSEAGASGGLGALFGGDLRGGAGRSGGAGDGSSGGTSGGGGEPALFGK